MTKYTIKAPSQLNASINLPASKSISNRALVISAMAGSHIQPDNLSDCDDTEVIVAALQNMPEVINIKAAGTAMRFMTAYLSATPGEHTITGTERMQNRPIGILVDALRYLGAVKPQPYKETSYMIENDWSASSYWYEMMALNGNIDSSIQLEGLMDCSKQGDSVVKYIFSLLGVKSEFENHDHLSNVMLKANRCLLPKFDYDFSGSPDLAQTIVVACCALGVKFRFTGLASLKIKETDRIEALKTELKKVGYVIHDENDNTLYWDGETCDPSFAPIDTYEDHRMAMAFAPLAFKFPQIEINNPEVVSKSYPHYWEDLKKVGFEIIESEE